MKNASDFILDLRQSEELCKAVENELSTVNIDDSQECIKCIVNVGNTLGYQFTERDYKDAAEEFSRNKMLEGIPKINEDILRGAWTTGGMSCVIHCPTL
jgi:uncharacterized protein YpuA (DUF1002 family)